MSAKPRIVTREEARARLDKMRRKQWVERARSRGRPAVKLELSDVLALIDAGDHGVGSDEFSRVARAIGFASPRSAERRYYKIRKTHGMAARPVIASSKRINREARAMIRRYEYLLSLFPEARASNLPAPSADQWINMLDSCAPSEQDALLRKMRAFLRKME